MDCPKCGNKIKENKNFCARCGYNFKQENYKIFDLFFIDKTLSWCLIILVIFIFCLSCFQIHTYHTAKNAYLGKDLATAKEKADTLPNTKKCLELKEEIYKAIYNEAETLYIECKYKEAKNMVDMLLPSQKSVDLKNKIDVALSKVENKKQEQHEEVKNGIKTFIDAMGSMIFLNTYVN